MGRRLPIYLNNEERKRSPSSKEDFPELFGPTRIFPCFALMVKLRNLLKFVYGILVSGTINKHSSIDIYVRAGLHSMNIWTAKSRERAHEKIF